MGEGDEQQCTVEAATRPQREVKEGPGRIVLLLRRYGPEKTSTTSHIQRRGQEGVLGVWARVQRKCIAVIESCFRCTRPNGPCAKAREENLMSKNRLNRL